MNKLIRELAERTVQAVDNPYPGNPLNEELEKMYIPDCFAERFTEEILSEIITTIYRSDISNRKQEALVSELCCKFGFIHQA